MDECRILADNCQQICTNTDGSFLCSCDLGFVSNAALCDDVNECDVNNGGCSQICINTVGSFQCLCEEGFQTGSDGRTCFGEIL